MRGEDVFFRADAKARVAQAVKRVEAQTAAEVVVAVRRRSATWRHADYLFGFVCALGVLAVLLFAPWPFLVETMPLDVVLAFAAGAFASSRLPAIARALTSRKARRAQAAMAARAAFVDLGVSRTSGRSGVLVYVSLLERVVEVVADVGFGAADRKALEPAFAALDASMAGAPDFGEFVAALDALGEPLGRALPHRDDDVNELPDEVDAS